MADTIITIVTQTASITEAAQGAVGARFFPDQQNHAEPVIPHQAAADEAQTMFLELMPSASATGSATPL
jgi:hypothetical protein